MNATYYSVETLERVHITNGRKCEGSKMSHMSTNKNITFPFSAIIGQEEMKKD